MCGFIGCMYNKPKEMNADIKNQFVEMNSIITHRGPDDEGYYIDDYVHFGFRRLSIVDLESGHQPLSYENERYWIIFNGEIYNHIELRKQLLNKGFNFSTHSDTEVLLALYSHYKEECVSKLRGMFAFVIWDKVEQKLFGARDYFGIKPFFYSEENGLTYFASEEKSILLALKGELNHISLQHYLSYQYVPEPETIMVQIKKLPPGHYFTQSPGGKLNIKSYWKPEFTSTQQTEHEKINQIRNALIDSVNVHMRSDVPVGSFLSGGIDSSFIVSLAKEVNPALKTFSVGFGVDGFSEINVAEETADALNLENINYLITPEEFLAEIPKIIWHMDDPLADPAAVPLYFVAREARKHVKVVLSGEGADELFGGYNIYREPQSLRMFNYIPNPIKHILLRLSRILPEGFKGKSFIERGVTPLEERYIGNAKIFGETEKKILLNHYNPEFDYKSITRPIYNQSAGYDPVTKMQNIDIHTWLRGDILVKADKVTMAHSIELRVPFLDKHVFEVASRLSSEDKINHKTTKYLMRKAAEGIVPDRILNRRKLGFPVPLRHWLKNELYDWAKNLITISQVDYIFNKQEIYKLLDEHVNNKRDNSRKLWVILMFMTWHQIYIEGEYDITKLATQKEQNNNHVEDSSLINV